MAASASALEAHARDQIRFFSNTGKQDRETWVIEAWCRLTGKTCCSIVKGERPDFTVGAEKVEIIEVLQPKRRRQDEVKKDAQEIFAGRLPQPRCAGSLNEVTTKGPLWILNAISAKTQKYHSICTDDWILLLYVNLSCWRSIPWDLVRSRLVAASHPFKQIDALGADGNEVIKLFLR